MNAIEAVGPYSLCNQWHKSAIYLYVIKGDNDPRITATGFLFRFSDSRIAIATNRHVLDGANEIQYFLRSKDPAHHETVFATLDSTNTFFHPNPQIDLAVHVIHMNTVKFMTTESDVLSLDESMIPSIEEIHSYTFAEDIIMFGSPRSLWDTRTALPVSQRGITARPISSSLLLEDRSFALDIGARPGSSGSPVFLLRNSYPNGINDTRLLGIYHKTHYRDEEIILPSGEKIMTQQYFDLGHAVLSLELLAFKELI